MFSEGNLTGGNFVLAALFRVLMLVGSNMSVESSFQVFCVLDSDVHSPFCSGEKLVKSLFDFGFRKY